MQHCVGVLKSECENDHFSFSSKQSELWIAPILLFHVTKAHKGSVVRGTLSDLKCFKFDIFHMQLMLQINIKKQDADILYFRKSVLWIKACYRKTCFVVVAQCSDVSGLTT